jgi:acetylornithine deacetylase/succinyl-diaminopimelate desuccinylase-like protein
MSESARRAVASLRSDDSLQALWRGARGARDEMIALLHDLIQIPAPTFHEGPRGDRAAQYLNKATGVAVESDAVGNRWVTLKGSLGPGPKLLFCAHLDTVFPAGTDCTVRRETGRLFGPGIGDDGAGLAIVLTGARLLKEAGLPFPGEFIIATNVGEEGLGNLRGVRALCERYGKELDGFLSLDGGMGNVVGEAVGVRRYRIGVKGPGGHSWSDFGTPSAVHHLVRIAASLSDLEVPAHPRTTFNVGVIQGGTSVNTVAQHAELLLDLRSIDASSLAGLDARAQKAIAKPPCPKELQVLVEYLGERPTGDPERTRDWIDVAEPVFSELKQPMKVTASSTDANVPIALGLRASTMGMCRGGRAHTTDEWLDPESLPVGLEAFLLAALTAARVFPRR